MSKIKDAPKRLPWGYVKSSMVKMLPKPGDSMAFGAEVSRHAIHFAARALGMKVQTSHVDKKKIFVWRIE